MDFVLLGLKPEQRLNVVGFHAFQELRVNQVDLIDKMSGIAATRSDSCTSAGRDWVTFAHGERKLFIYVEVRSPSSSTSAMEVIHTDMKPCVLSNVASGTDNCTETLVEQPTEHDAEPSCTPDVISRKVQISLLLDAG